jgi:DUF1365 family protein
MHARRGPRANVFRYRVCFYVLDLDELDRLPLVRRRRFGLLTYSDRDHVDVRAFLAGHGVEADRILLLTNLRVLGYVFNPVSFFFCYRGGELACVVAEINNTFGERLPTLLRVEDATGPLRFRTGKRLHVSPFLGLEQEYEFEFCEPGERAYAKVDVYEDGELVLATALHGRRREPTLGAMLGSLARYPLMPVQVIALIHWQALRLWLKRVPFHHKPPFVPGEGSVR